MVAWGGALHPELQRQLDQTVFMLELSLESLSAHPRQIARQSPLPRVPAVTRDLSLVLDQVDYGEVVKVLHSVEPPAPARFDALDRSEGPPLATGQTSLTVRVRLEPLEQTLTDEATERYVETLVARLRDELGVGIRS